jgi:hypothetical protein
MGALFEGLNVIDLSIGVGSPETSGGVVNQLQAASGRDKAQYPADASTALVRLLRSSDRPVLLAGSEAARTSFMGELAASLSTDVVNLGAALAIQLMDAGARVDVAAEIAIIASGTGPLLLDHIEILFLPQLKIDLVDTLVRASRRRPLCVSWPGRAEQGRLKYADYNHPECLDVDASRVAIFDLSSDEGAYE